MATLIGLIPRESGGEPDGHGDRRGNVVDKLFREMNLSWRIGVWDSDQMDYRPAL